MSRDEYSIIAIDVDDLMLSCKSDDHIAGIKSALKEEFSIKDLSEIICCLEIETDRKRDTRVIKMKQRAYIERPTEKFGVRTARTHTDGQHREVGQAAGRENVCFEAYVS